jgi:cyclopropane fatty-acyl-phospholipid synthase-like methyltransferase
VSPTAISPLARDRLALYEASVQGVEYDLDFFERVWRATRGGRFRTLREDFCGTAQLACAWVRRRPLHRAWGVDLDAGVLAWAKEQHLVRMRGASRRVALLRRDVRTVSRPPVDVVVALNFSYWTFKERADLRRYFRAVQRSLGPRGLFFLNLFGGTAAMDRLVETRRIAPSTGPDGLRLPGFTYVWEQARFNPVDHHLLCHIHFHFAGGTQMRRAFTYDWRLWTLPEVRELLAEAGFRSSEVYVEGWDHHRHQPEDDYRRRRRFENQLGWLAFVVGIA